MAEFDSLAANYRRLLERTSWMSGADPDYFLRQRLRWASGWERPAGAVVDLGCGVGMAARAFEEFFPGVELIGVDPSRESIDVARRQSTRMRFACVDGDRLPLDAGAAGVVHASGVLHHVEPGRRAGLLAEARRVLAPGGLLVIFENSPAHPVMRLAMRINPIDAQAWPVWPGPLRQVLDGAGFEVESVRWHFSVPGRSAVGRRIDRLLAGVPLGAQYSVVARPRNPCP